MKVYEIFHSIQGEGVTMGIPTAFVRLTGCNLRCRWCDTKYAYEGGEELSIQDIRARIQDIGAEQVCITGGEPLLQEDVPTLVDQLLNDGFLVTLETNGSLSIEPMPCSEALMISMDIKCPGSGEDKKMDFANIEMLSPGDQLKFIIADEGDYDYAKAVIEKYKPTCNVVMTPVPSFSLKNLAESVLADGLGVRVLPQLHKIIWGNEPGK